MPRVAPFEALVYDTDVAGPIDLVTSRPYDVINASLRGRYEDRSPYNVVRIDLPGHGADGEDPYGSAAATLRRWIADGVVRRTAPGYIAYELDYPGPGGGRATLRGLIVAVRLEPWGGSVLPHEEVMPGPVDDRLRLLRATRTHLSPIYGAVTGPVAPLQALWDRVSGPPDAEVVDIEDVRHRTWWVPPDPAVASAIEHEELLIADGHHRYTTALRYRDERRATEGPGPWDEVLAFIVDAGSQPIPVGPYHRIQRTGVPLPGGSVMARDDAMARLTDDPPTVVTVTLHDGSPRFALHALEGPGPAVAALHRTPVDTVGNVDGLVFTQDPDAAVAAVGSDGALAAYLLPATDTRTIMRVVRGGERLPRKSTFFWPKPRTGLAMMPLDDAGADAGPVMDRSAPPVS